MTKKIGQQLNLFSDLAKGDVDSTRITGGSWPDKELLTALITTKDEDDIMLKTAEQIRIQAEQIRREVYGTDVYIRGLIEFTNICKNDCYYCGLRCGNLKVERYRLTKEQIWECCDSGYDMGFRTFVLQGGEDPHYTDKMVCEIVSGIKERHLDCAVTLSIGEKTRKSYKQYFDAGADRYLLRHETANAEHYAKLHPPRLTAANRKRCLYDLKEIGYQVGSGFMVGSPGQTIETLEEDLMFLKELEPQMVGIGPFIPHKNTPFANKKAGSVDLTLHLLSLIRIMLPNVLLPATTALASLGEDGRQRGILAGANVVMPNLSPQENRKKYALYNNKADTGAESAEGLKFLEEKMREIGYNIVADRGDCKGFAAKPENER